MSNILVNTAYFPPVQYFAEIKAHSGIQIEQYENYGKQSYRNRCDIMTANGVKTLSVPVIKGSSIKILTKDVQVDYSTNWQKLHFKGIESAYKNSPYYDYYIDNFISFFERKEKFLLDLNTKILQELLNNLSLQRPICFTEDYDSIREDIEDLRDAIHPKPSRRRREIPFTAKPYHQTFAERFPFAPNLSILDLLFNMGPESAEFF